MQPHVIVISGPGGVGKNTVADGLIQTYPREFVSVTKLTTRAIRPGETEGNEFNFLSPKEFKHRLAAHELLEFNIFNNNYYGVPKSPVDLALAQGKSPILVIDVNGARATRRHYGTQAYLVFLTAPIDDLRRRYIARGQSEQEAAKRIQIARHAELPEQRWYDLVLENPNGHVGEVIQTIAKKIHSL